MSKILISSIIGIIVIGILIGIYYYSQKDKSVINKDKSYCESNGEKCSSILKLDDCSLLFNSENGVLSAKSKDNTIIPLMDNPSSNTKLNPPYTWSINDGGIIKIYDKIGTNVYGFGTDLGISNPYQLRPIQINKTCGVGIYDKSNKMIWDNTQPNKAICNIL